MTDPDARLRDLTASPLNPLPGGVWVLLIAVAGVEGVLLAASQGWIGGPQGLGWRIALIERAAFGAAIQDWMIETHRAPWRHLVRYVAYPWVQAGPMASVLVLAMLAALGKAVVEGLGARTLWAVVLLVPPLAALAFGLIAGANDAAWLVGAMPLVFGLVGAFTWGRWRQAAGDRAAQLRAFGLIGVLMLARLGFGLMVEAGMGWVADLAAFGLGLGLATAVSPGAAARLRDRLRG